MNSPELIVRTGRPTDAETLTRFNLALAAETESRHLDPATVRAGVEAVLTDPNKGVYYLAERAGNVVGSLMITREWSDWRNGHFWWIQSVFVVPEARGSSVYSTLHRHVEQSARAAAGCGLRLYVDDENVRAQAVYRALGMVASNYTLFEVDWGQGPLPG